MKKYISLACAGLLCLTASIGFAEQNNAEYGIGGRIANPTDFIFNLNNYSEIRTNSKEFSAMRVAEGYCLDMIPISENDILQDRKGAAGTLLITSDAYLQNSHFYSLDAAGIIAWNKLTGEGLVTDTRKGQILSDNKSIAISDYRITLANGYSYYTAIEPGNLAYKLNYHDGIHYGNILASKPLNFDYMRPDASSSTGYQNQNYEIITYHVNKPMYNSNSRVYGMPLPGQSGTSQVINLTPNILGCYAVQPYANGIDFGGPTIFYHHVEFLWLVEYNYKTAYPVMEMTASTLSARQTSIFSTDAYPVSYSWSTTLRP